MGKFLSVFLPQIRKDPDLQERLIELAEWAYRFSPLVSPDSPSEDRNQTSDASFRSLYTGINLDIAAGIRLFRGELNLLQEIEHGLSLMGLKARIAVAPTLGAAWAISRYGEQRFSIIDNSSLKETLSPLPANALRIDQRTNEALTELNILRIGDLLDIPGSSLCKRFGASLTKRLAQALGEREEIVSPIHPRIPLRVKKCFSAPLEYMEPVLRETFLLLEKLLEKLEKRHEKISKLSLEIRPTGSAPITKNISFSLPSSDKRHIRSLLENRILSLECLSGVEEISLSISHAQHCHPQEISSFSPTAQKPVEERIFGEMLDTLSEHLGEQRVLGLVTNESFVPEESFSYLPFSKNKHPDPFSMVDAERPTILFPFPEPVLAIAEITDKPPLRLRWRNAVYDVSTGIGPERIAPKWWGRDPSLLHTRDYFRIQLRSGIWLWMFRDLETSHWFIHGIWA